MMKIIYIFLILLIFSYCKNSKEITKDKPIGTTPTISQDSCLALESDNGGEVVSNFKDIIILQGSGKTDKNVKVVKKGKTSIVVPRGATTDILDLEKEIARIIQLEDKGDKGIVAYSFPSDEMKVAYKYKITLRITKENNIEAARVLVIGDRNIPIYDQSTNSNVSIENIRVDQKMSAYLISDTSSFSIVKINSELQEIEDLGYTEWSWIVSPLKGGKSYLKMIIKIKIKREGETTFKDIIVFDKNIEVKSNIPYSLESWFSKYWQWITTTLVIPFIVWFYKRRKKEEE